jgi:hypothetical protein
MKMPKFESYDEATKERLWHLEGAKRNALDYRQRQLDAAYGRQYEEWERLRWGRDED